MTTNPNRRSKRAARLCIAIVLVFCGLAGFVVTQRREPPPLYRNWPETLSYFRFRWSADPGIDLLSGPAVPLRAYLESHRLAYFTVGINAAYPGFEHAVPEAMEGPFSARTPYQLWSIRPPHVFGPLGEYFGNEYFHILELTPTETGYRAYICDGLYNVFRKDRYPSNQNYVSIIKWPSDAGVDHVDGVQVWRVELAANDIQPNGPAIVKTPQYGSNPAPLDDVFGVWRITGATNGYWGTLINRESVAWEDVGEVNRISQCSDRMPHNYAQRRTMYLSEPDSPPTTDPGVPGWPSHAP